MDFGRVIVGGAVSGTANLATSGSDSERTRVTVGTTTTADGNGIRVTGGSGTDFKAAAHTGTRTLAGSFTSAGAKSGSRGLSVTGEELAGEGTYTNVAVNYPATVLDHAQAVVQGASVSGSAPSYLVDVGPQRIGATGSVDLKIANHTASAGATYTAKLDLDGISLTGDVTSLSANVSTFSGLAGGQARPAYSASLTPSDHAVYSTTYSLLFSDENLIGATSHSLNVELTGLGVGPAFAAQLDGFLGDVERIDVGDAVEGQTVSRLLQIGNITPDDNGGGVDLTDLTLLDVVFDGSDASMFSLTGFTPGMRFSKDDWQDFYVSFSPTGLPGERSATMTLVTDQGAPLGQSGDEFTFYLSGQTVPAPPSAVMLAGLGVTGLAFGAARRRWRK